MGDHSILEAILEKRQKKQVTNPIWEMALSSSEYEALKRKLREVDSNVFGSLLDYPQEAAICYAEWWRTEYNGGTPSKEDIARSIGLYYNSAEDLYEAAKKALRIWRLPIIRHWNSLRFRTLLLQGGLPIEYVKHNLGSYKKFLEVLVEELSQINSDWEDTSIIPKLRCYWFLPQSFRNDDIFSLSLQIARAIIEERIDLLPYNSNSGELEELTLALQKKWKESQKIVRKKSLSIQWELRLIKSETGSIGKISYCLENVRNLYASSIEELRHNECYQFDVYVSKSYVATYKRVSSETGEVVYRRMNTTNVKIEWKGEPCVEVKIKTDQEKSFFTTIDGCCPPDFSYLQLFHKREKVYVRRVQEDSDDSVVIFNNEWLPKVYHSEDVNIAGAEYKYVRISDQIDFINIQTGELTTIANKKSSYNVEFKAPFLNWLEDSNYIIINKAPSIFIYDADNRLVKSGYSVFCKKKTEFSWHEFRYNIVLPTGLLDFKVLLPDGTEQLQSFYSIGGLTFKLTGLSSILGRIECDNVPGQIMPIFQEGMEYTSVNNNSWVVKRPETDFFPPTCSFKLLTGDDKPLEITIPSPFEGVCLVNEKGNIVPNGKTISMSNLLSYRIVERGKEQQYIKFSYIDKNGGETNISISTPVYGKLVTLSNYEDTIARLFDLYGVNPFDRHSAVTLTINDNTYYIRNFTLDTKQVSRTSVRIIKLNQDDLQFPYDGKLFACSACDPKTEASIGTFELYKLDNEEFSFPDDCVGDFIIFSDVYAKDRIVPKLYSILPEITEHESLKEANEGSEEKVVLNSFNQLHQFCTSPYLGDNISDDDFLEKKNKQIQSVKLWNNSLSEESAIFGLCWKKVTEYIDIANEYKLPFNTFNTINAAVTTPSLFAKLILRLYMDGKKDDLLNNINKLEREFGIAVHWLRPMDFKATADEIFQQPPFLINNLLRGYSEFFRDLLSVTLEKECADIISRYIMNSEEHGRTKVYFESSDINEFKARAKGKAENDQDLPKDYLPLVGRYYNYESVSKFSCRSTIINAPLYVFEYLTGINDDLWTRKNGKYGRVINFYRHYFLRTYCEILSKCFSEYDEFS